MKRTIYLILLTFLAYTNVSAQDEHFVSLDPADASFSKIGLLNNVNWIQPKISAYSQALHRYYFCGSYGLTNWRLYTVDAYTGNVIDSPSFLNELQPMENIYSLEYNDADNKLYGMHWDGVGKEQSLISVDPASGAFQTIAHIPGLSAGAMTAMIDGTHNRYYFPGIDTGGNSRLYVIDMSNGAIVAAPPVLSGIMQLKLDYADGVMYGIINSTDSPQYFGRIDVATGVVTKVKALDGITGFYGGANFFTYDEVNKNYYCVGIDKEREGCLLTINARTGDITNRPYFPHVSSSGKNIICFQYDNNLDKLFALHWQPVPDGSRATVYPNPFQTISVLYLDGTYKQVTAVLYSADGKRIREESVTNTNKMAIARQHLAAGNYVLRVFGDNEFLGNIKLVAY